MKKSIFKILPIALYILSICCFVVGLTQPIMTTTKFFGWSKSTIYLYDSVQYFLDNGEWLIGVLLLFFTFIFPIFKYLFLGLQLLGIKMKAGQTVSFILEIINKWAMLDVFVVALIIVNLKTDSGIISTELNTGTTWFAVSILLLMVCSLILSRRMKLALKAKGSLS